MDKLNHDILMKLKPNVHLEVVDVDVKRLRDDRTEIHLGQEVAFVATFALRVTQEGVTVIRAQHASLSRHGSSSGAADCWQHLAAEDRLLEIGADAEVRSDKVPIDEDHVIRWIDQNYKFTFALDGIADAPSCSVFREVGRVQVQSGDTAHGERELALPWLRKLGIADFPEDYIDVSVRIEPRSEHENSGSQVAPKPPVVSHLPFGITLEAKLEVPPNLLFGQLVGRPFQIIDKATGAHISLVLKPVPPAENKPPLAPSAPVKDHTATSKPLSGT